MRPRRQDLLRCLAVSLMSSAPVALMTFDFMFPNVSAVSMDKNLLTMLLVSILAGVPSGYFIMRTDLALATVIAYVSIGYASALVYYSLPYTLFDIELVLPSFYYLLFLRYTVILLFIFVLGGFVGAVFGQYLRDSLRKERTSLTFSDEGGG